jgi:hypothetical protein
MLRCAGLRRVRSPRATILWRGLYDNGGSEHDLRLRNEHRNNHRGVHFIGWE